MLRVRGLANTVESGIRCRMPQLYPREKQKLVNKIKSKYINKIISNKKIKKQLSESLCIKTVIVILNSIDNYIFNSDKNVLRNWARFEVVCKITRKM